MIELSGPSMILPVEPVVPAVRANLDVYLPEADGPAPCVLLVHGLFAERPETMPRQSRFFRDYASHLARKGIVAAVVDHDLTDGMRFPEASAAVGRAVEELRNQPEVDPDVVGLWMFSGGGPLSYPFLADPPPWLRGLELTYPMLPAEDIPGWPTMDQAVAGTKTVPTFITVVEHEMPMFAPDQQVFLERVEQMGSPVTVQTVAGAAHGFDALEPQPHAQKAVAAGLDWMVWTLT
ncbi:MAG: alpha/beta hydrolase [Rhodococcus sp.]|nr:alpha/beta hydrolase [Rhodococcus sp. (in: high G+C Gram-positive bacteria)]